MKSLLLLQYISLLGLQAARGSPLTSASSAIWNPLSAISGASTISLVPSLNWTANISANSTLQNALPITGSTKAINIGGPVTVIRTIELIPQPVSSGPSAGAAGFFETPESLSSNVPTSAIDTQQATLPTTSPPARSRSYSEQSVASSPQVQISQPVDESIKRPMLQPIIVGGITYAPVHAHHTHSNAFPWQEPPRASQTKSEAVEWHEYYAKHDSELDGLDHKTLESGHGQMGLAPVVVGGLTYRPVGKEIKSGWQTSATLNVAGSVESTAKPAANLLVGTMSSPAQSGSMAANSPYSAGVSASSPVSIQSPSPTSPPATSVLVLGSQTLTALPGSSGFILGNSTLLPGSPAITVNSTAYYLNPSATLTVGNTTFVLATSGAGTSEGPSGPLTAANETFIPLDSTAISIDRTTLSISGPAVTKNSTLLSLATDGLIIGSSTFAFATPAPNTAETTITSATLAPTSSFTIISVQPIIPASPPTFIIAGETFTAYPSGLAISGTEVFQGSTAITLSGTAISLGSSDIVIGASTIPFASVTGLGAALSSGLVTGASASGGGLGPTATSTGGKNSHVSAAGHLKVKGKMGMVWLAIVALVIVVV
ncbi:MAG: hypothetical protein Q9161_003153 [Pseudevernia consocians]